MYSCVYVCSHIPTSHRMKRMVLIISRIIGALYLLHVIASFLTSLFYYILCFLAAFQHKMLCIYFFIIFPQFGLMEYNNAGGRHAENGNFQHFFTILPNAPIGILTKVEFNRVIQIAAQTQSLPNFTGHFKIHEK